MYTVNPLIRRQFEEQTGQPAYQFLNNLSSYAREMVLLLMELEYKRGCGDGMAESQYDKDETYNRGYDDGYDAGYADAAEEE